ncbi:meiotic chromosome condensation [Desmophyllum pertusum]|uniref:Meiotic chromosome condensation n=1 Tax=Desmophyllum pertusum TaxID=174260 RepID=A0A9W9ZDX3_9CNID|nr:meiotic chromosome condensation [Desmophyllum pertusum]
MTSAVYFCSPSLSDSAESNTNTRCSNSPTACHAGILARFLSLSGHVALRHMVHLDVGVLGEIKRRQVIEENDKGKEKQAKKTRGAGSESSINSSKDPGASETIEEELGLTGASADDVETEYVRKICEHEIVTGSSSDHQSNTIVAVGDLTFRFPNLIGAMDLPSVCQVHWRDESGHVRKNTLMVLTHLILNDMVKVKGQISEMATCLEDKDSRISDLAKLFFLELSQEVLLLRNAFGWNSVGNAIYNILPDVISRLSDPDCGIEEGPFKIS